MLQPNGLFWSLFLLIELICLYLIHLLVNPHPYRYASASDTNSFLEIIIHVPTYYVN